MKEVVIKMSEEMYDWFLTGFPDKVDMDELQRLVIEGTVLPKGHGDLIDRNKIKCSDCGKFGCENSDICATYHAQAIIKADGGNK